MKANFKVDTEIKIHSTGSSHDGSSGTIIGKSSEHAEMDFYIVMLDKQPAHTQYIAITVPEHCLNKI